MEETFYLHPKLQKLVKYYVAFEQMCIVITNLRHFFCLSIVCCMLTMFSILCMYMSCICLDSYFSSSTDTPYVADTLSFSNCIF